MNINSFNWANVNNNDISPLEFIDDVEIEEMNFMLYNKFVYYKIKNKNKTKMYHGVLDIVVNKVVFNTDEEIEIFIPYSSKAMLAITPTTAYKICIYKENNECVEECENGYNLDLNGNTCGSKSNCPDNQIMLIPNGICFDSYDKHFL